MQAPRALADYARADQVGHLAHERRDAALWAAFFRIIPDYEARKARLLALGPALSW